MNKILDFLQINIGFSWKGLVVFLLPMLPNVLFFILKDPNGRMAVTNNHLLLDIIEHGSQGIYAVLLIFLVSRKESPILSGYMIFIVLFLLAYFGLWVAYFTIGANFTMLMLMAIIPVIYFIIAEIWLHNLPAVVFTAIFGIVHVIITYINYH
jgi:hypothetical protein